MTIPCVGYAGQLEEIAPLVEAGAEFIAVGEDIWRSQMRGAIDALARTPEPVR
jgi:thiamine monophosphate synthase